MTDETEATPDPVPGDASKDERNMAMLCHLGGTIVFFLTGVLGWLVPLIVYLTKKDESAMVREHAVESLNFQITLLIGMAVTGALTAILIGCILMPIVWIGGIVFGIIASIRASEGTPYRYPVNLRFIS